LIPGGGDIGGVEIGELYTALPIDTLLTETFPYGSRNSAGNDEAGLLSSAIEKSAGATVAA